MSRDQWEQLRSSLLIHSCKESLEPRAFPDVFAFVETALDFVLPTSYCDYIKVFGPGTFADNYRIAAPGFPDQFWAANLLSLNEMMARFEHQAPPNQPQPMVHQSDFVYFCTTQSGTSIGWKRDDDLTGEGNERAVYGITRSGEGSKRLAETFTRFILDVCLKPSRTDEDDESEESHRVFVPENDLVSLSLRSS